MADICEAGLTGCTIIATDHHHRKSRARGGSDHKRNIVKVCHPCHMAIHAHKPWTKRFRTHSWQEEGQTEEEA